LTYNVIEMEIGTHEGGTTMALLDTPRFSTDQFSFDGGCEFSCDVSDLGYSPLGRTFDDACDCGLTLVSANTGMAIRFSEIHSEFGEDGLLYTDLAPVGPPANDPNLRILRVRLYND
jgi:hypothetical protein